VAAAETNRRSLLKLDGHRCDLTLAESAPCDTCVVRVLLVEDDLQLLAATARGLRNSGFAIDVADRGEDALAKTAVTEYDVVVLDRDLPGMHGDDGAGRSRLGQPGF